MKPVQPDDKLSQVVGAKPLPRTELTKKLWAYIRKNGLQDKKVRTQINADENLKAVFNGKKQERNLQRQSKQGGPKPRLRGRRGCEAGLSTWDDIALSVIVRDTKVFAFLSSAEIDDEFTGMHDEQRLTAIFG